MSFEMLLHSIENIDASGVLAFISIPICFIGMGSTGVLSFDLDQFAFATENLPLPLLDQVYALGLCYERSLYPKSSLIIDEELLTEKKLVRLLLSVETITGFSPPHMT